MNVTKQEFDTFKAEVNSSFERLQSDIRSSYTTIIQYFERLETHLDQKFEGINQKFEGIDKKFEGIEKKIDRMDHRLTQVSDDLVQMRSNFGARLDVITGQLRIVDQGQLRIDERLAHLERRVYVLEDKAS
jgi:archaellum component FlaC